MTNGNHVVRIGAGLAAGTLITKVRGQHEQISGHENGEAKSTYQTDIEEGTFAMVGFSTAGRR